MNDAFTRQRLSQLTGLTVHTQKSGSSTALTQSDWTALNLTGITTPLTLHLIIAAFKLTTTATDAVLRFIVDGNKIFPFTASVDVQSGVDQFLQFTVQVPVGHSFSVEVFTDEAAKTANINYLSVVEVETLDHS